MHPYNPTQSARQRSSFSPGGTVEDAAHDMLANIIADLDDPDATDVYVYDEQLFTCHSYMIAGNGPSAWVYVTRRPNGVIDDMFLLYSEGATAAIRVPTQYHEQLAEAIERELDG